jgi:hypothetical protein
LRFGALLQEVYLRTADAANLKPARQSIKSCTPGTWGHKMEDCLDVGADLTLLDSRIAGGSGDKLGTSWISCILNLVVPGSSQVRCWDTSSMFGARAPASLFLDQVSFPESWGRACVTRRCARHQVSPTLLAGHAPRGDYRCSQETMAGQMLDATVSYA